MFASPHDAETVQKRYPEIGVKLHAEILTETRWLKRAVVAAEYVAVYRDAVARARGRAAVPAAREEAWSALER